MRAGKVRADFAQGLFLSVRERVRQSAHAFGQPSVADGKRCAAQPLPLTFLADYPQLQQEYLIKRETPLRGAQ